MTDTCGTCVFSKHIDPRRVICRRYPPIMYPERRAHQTVVSFVSAFPRMEIDAWCGEFKEVLSHD